MRGVTSVSRQVEATGSVPVAERAPAARAQIPAVDAPPRARAQLRPAAQELLDRHGGSADAQRCLAIVESLGRDLSEQQINWLLSTIRIYERPDIIPTEIPTSPMAFDACLALLGRADPRPVRFPLHLMVVASLGESPLLERAKAALPGLPTEQLLRLSFHIGASHGLRRELSRVIEERLVGVATPPGSGRTFRWTSLGSCVPGAELARRSIERGKELIGPELTAKAEELRRLPVAADVANDLLREKLRLDLETGLARVVQGLIDTSPVGRTQALAAARALSFDTYDAFGRGRLLEMLATVVQLTRGTVLRILTGMRDHATDARPELRKRLECSQDRPQHPMFPLRDGDSLSASAHVNPMLATETFHELGHAYECAEPDVLRGALALRQMLAIGSMRSLNDLAVIHAVAVADGRPGTHARLLRHVAQRETWPTLDSAEALRSLLAGCDVDAAMNSVLRTDWSYLRLYGADETALPIAAHPYLGKVDPDGSTELVSTGFEHLPDPVTLAAAFIECPEHVAFTLGCLAQPKVPEAAASQ